MTKRFESRRFFLAVLAACWIIWAATGENSAQGGQVVERIVAVINDEVITLFDLNQVLAPYERQILATGYEDGKREQMLFKVREDMLNQLIDQKLTDQEIKKHRISVSDKEIDATIEQIKNANRYTDESLRSILASQDMSYEEYREKIREQILRAKLVNIEVRSRVVITPEEVRAFYESHPEMFQGARRYHLRNILMKAPSSENPNAIQATAEKFNRVLDQLKSGQSIEDLARRYSEAPNRNQGGDLGFFRLDQLSPQLQEHLEDLNAGDVTPILSTDQGFQVFYIEAVEAGEGKTLEEATAEIQDRLYKEVVDSKFQAWLEALRQRSHVRIVR